MVRRQRFGALPDPVLAFRGGKASRSSRMSQSGASVRNDPASSAARDLAGGPRPSRNCTAVRRGGPAPAGCRAGRAARATCRGRRRSAHRRISPLFLLDWSSAQAVARAPSMSSSQRKGSLSGSERVGRASVIVGSFTFRHSKSYARWAAHREHGVASGAIRPIRFLGHIAAVTGGWFALVPGFIWRPGGAPMR